MDQNKGKHPQAVIDTLKTLIKRWPSINSPGNYAQKIVDIQSGNYCERDHMAQTQAETAGIQKGMAQVAERLGFDLPIVAKVNSAALAPRMAKLPDADKNLTDEQRRLKSTFATQCRERDLVDDAKKQAEKMNLERVAKDKQTAIDGLTVQDIATLDASIKGQRFNNACRRQFNKGRRVTVFLPKYNIWFVFGDWKL